VFYYVPPQIWAWAVWRVSKVRKFVDLVLCSLTFEPAWYKQRGVSQAVYVGHPYFDELTEQELDEEFLAQQAGGKTPLLLILPGSRTQELTRNLPIMVRAAAKLARHRPDTRFAVACLHDGHKALAEEIIKANAQTKGGQPDPIIDVHSARTPELIRLADVAWSVSGSVSLELMMEALPTVILYKLNRFDLLIARPFIKAKYITLVNLLADAELMPEYLTEHDVSDELAGWAGTWLGDPTARARVTANLAALRHQVAQPGASGRAAYQIENWLIAHSRHAAPIVSKMPLYRGPHDLTTRDESALTEGSQASQ
jgi:lipid-A-disaccharide synthase